MNKFFQLFLSMIISILFVMLIPTQACAQNLKYKEIYDDNFNKSCDVTISNTSNKTITSIEFSFTLVNYYCNMIDHTLSRI